MVFSLFSACAILNVMEEKENFDLLIGCDCEASTKPQAYVCSFISKQNFSDAAPIITNLNFQTHRIHINFASYVVFCKPQTVKSRE